MDELPPAEALRDKRLRRERMAERALAEMERWRDEHALVGVGA
jgi:hypothetical protein